MLVDRNPQTFARLELIFRTSEFQLVYTEDTQSAGRWLERNTPLALISEVGPDGAVLRDLVRRFPVDANGNKGCLVVAVGTPEEQSTAITLGADLFVATPVEKNILEELRRVMNRQRPRKLLLVEDNDVSMYILRELLDRPWLSLLEARNGQEALDAVSREQPDAVVLDLLMPGMDGFEVLRKLRSREESRQLPVIVCTSKSLTDQDKVQLESMRVGLISKADIASRMSSEVLLESLFPAGHF